MSISVDFSGLRKLITKVSKMPRRTDAYVEETVAEYGKALLKETIKRASGRPGPNIVTGQYVSAMYIRTDDPKRIAVGNDSPQAYRLEYGFVGTDSLGRAYNQPPYPHFRPALAEIEPDFKKAMRRAPLRAWRSL